MSTQPNRITRENKWTSLFGAMDPQNFPYGPGSLDYGLTHNSFKRFGGPETELPQPKHDNSFWNQFFNLAPNKPPALDYQGKEPLQQRPDMGPLAPPVRSVNAAPAPAPEPAPAVDDAQPWSYTPHKYQIHNDWESIPKTQPNLDVLPAERPAQPVKRPAPADPHRMLRRGPPIAQAPMDDLMQFFALMQG